MRKSMSGLALAVVALSSVPARATGRFPPTIQRDLQLSYQPPCSLCHLKGNTGLGTADTPFALAMRARGMTGEGAAGLSAALDILQQDRVDDDGDGVSDVDELVAGTDPNTAASLRDRPEPSYGCGGGSGGSRQGRAPVTTIFVATALAFTRRRR